jgi:hypothetical protein
MREVTAGQGRGVVQAALRLFCCGTFENRSVIDDQTMPKKCSCLHLFQYNVIDDLRQTVSKEKAMKRIMIARLLIALITIFSVGTVVDAAPARTQTTYLRAMHSGKCVDVSNNSNANGATIQQYDCNGTGAQQWDLVYMGSGPKFRGQAGNYYALRKHNTNMCLDVSAASTENGAQIILWECHGGANQQFLLYNHTRIWDYVFTPVNLNSGKCLDVAGASKENGAWLVQYDCHLNNNQRFFWNGQ